MPFFGASYLKNYLDFDEMVKHKDIPHWEELFNVVICLTIFQVVHEMREQIFPKK